MTGAPLNAARDGVPRSAVLSLLIAQAFVLFPHIERMSWGVLAVGLFAWLWRFGMFLGRVPRAGVLLRGGLALLGACAALLSVADPFSLDLAVQMLLVAFLLKALEVTSRRDAFIVVLIAWFCVGVEFLFRQDMLIALWGASAVVLVAAVLPALAASRTVQQPLPDLRRAAWLVAQALPLAVIVFVFFPRVAPLWNVPTPSLARTGVTDRIEPGAIAQISQSNAIAFRVSFDAADRQQVPRQEFLYWRGLLYYAYADGVWTQGEVSADAGQLIDWRGGRRLPWRDQLQGREAAAIDHEVTLEATQQNWLFALDVPVAPPPRAGLTRDWRLLTANAVAARVTYPVRSIPGAVLDPDLPDWLRSLSLDAGTSDPRTRALARDLFRGDADTYVRDVLSWYRQQGFAYTLNPPVIEAADQVDAFLFDTRAGFCSHFAGSFVLLMRAAGLPARLVGGYQGGEWNEMGGFLTVRQRDAHSWAEVWLPERGWLRVDPTAAVAPARISAGLEAALRSDADQQLLAAGDPLGVGDWGWIVAATLWFESLEFRWNTWVMGYDGNTQLLVLGRWFGDIDRLDTVGYLVVGTLATVVLAWFLIVGGRRAPAQAPEVRVWRQLRRRLARLGIAVAAGDTPGALRDRLATADARVAAPANRIIGQLEVALYRDTQARLPQDCRADLRRLWWAGLIAHRH